MSQKETLEKLHELFQTPGWAEFTKHLEECREGVDVRTIADSNALFFTKGKLAAWDEIAALPVMVTQALEQEDAV